MFKEIREDLKRYCYRLELSPLIVILFQPGFLAAVTFRIGHRIYSSRYNDLFLFKFVRITYSVWTRISEILTGIFIDPRCEIKSGIFMPHFGGIVIGANLGRNCDIFQGVTLGSSGYPNKLDVPTIGDRVFIGAGAKVIGDIVVGNDVVIGANVVLNKSVPDRAVVIGNPARIISRSGSFKLISYPGMENDPDRQASLAFLQPKDDEEDTVVDTAKV